MTEVWKRYGRSPYRSYEISSGGRVRRNGRVLKGYVSTDGYSTVLLSYAGLSRRFRLSRLVCETFHGPAPEGHHAAHLDGNVSNNAASNLAWKSPKDNNADKLLHGTHQAGILHPRVRLTPEQVEAIKISPLSSRAAAKCFGVGQSQIVRIRKGQRWIKIIAQPQSGASS